MTEKLSLCRKKVWKLAGCSRITNTYRLGVLRFRCGPLPQQRKQPDALHRAGGRHVPHAHGLQQAVPHDGAEPGRLPRVALHVARDGAPPYAAGHIILHPSDAKFC